MAVRIQDFRYALRTLWKSPGFTMVAGFTLALGIGANMVLFSVVNGVFLNPLPYSLPQQLVTLHGSKPNFEQGSISYPNFRDWQKENHTFSAIAVFRSYAFSHGLLDSIRHASAQMIGQQVIFGAQSMDEIISTSPAGRRFSMILLGLFAALALLLASVGLHGVISSVVGQRTHEIGIPMALGAPPLDILRRILTGGGRLALLGAGIGLVSALGLTKLNLPYGVSPTDPLTFIAVSAILILVALLASYFPAYRATKVVPLVALRYE